jgi:hypothetical protein
MRWRDKDGDSGQRAGHSTDDDHGHAADDDDEDDEHRDDDTAGEHGAGADDDEWWDVRSHVHPGAHRARAGVHEAGRG